MKGNEWSKHYDELTAQALALGVCPKVVAAHNGYRDAHFCGKPLAEGARFCAKHRYGV